MAEPPRLRSLRWGAPATVQRKHDADFSPQYEFHRSVQSLLRDFPGGISANWNIGAGALVLFHAAKHFPRTARAIQSQTSRGR